jgi:hypothetical protein
MQIISSGDHKSNCLHNTVEITAINQQYKAVTERIVLKPHWLIQFFKLNFILFETGIRSDSRNSKIEPGPVCVLQYRSRLR